MRKGYTGMMHTGNSIGRVDAKDWSLGLMTAMRWLEVRRRTIQVPRAGASRNEIFRN
jgi:hypothetical protein